MTLLTKSGENEQVNHFLPVRLTRRWFAENLGVRGVRPYKASMRSVVDAGGELVDEEPQRCPVGVVVKFRDPSGVLHDLLQFDAL